VAAAAAAFVLTRHGDTTDKQSPSGATATSATSAAPTKTAPAAMVATARRQPMRSGWIDRESAAGNVGSTFHRSGAGSALAVYRDVLLIDPNNGEAGRDCKGWLKS